MKLLSESPDYEDAAIEGIRQMSRTPHNQILPEDRVAMDSLWDHRRNQRAP